MSTRMIVILVAIAVAISVLYSSVFVVTERNQALVLRLGEITQVKTEPGLYFKVPTSIYEEVQFIDKRLLTIDMENKTCLLYTSPSPRDA